MPGCKRAGDCIGWFNEGAARTRKGVEGIADRVPAYAQMSHHSAGLLGESTNKFFSDAGAFLRCELTADVFYRIDGPTIHYDVYNIESEVLGARLIWSEGQIPTVDSRNPLLNSVDAFQRLHPIKTGMAGRMPYVMEINKWLGWIWGCHRRYVLPGLLLVFADLSSVALA